MKVPMRYQMNMGVLSQSDLERVQEVQVIVIGLGGLGGNVVNQLVRLGVRHFTLVDPDCFSESNLNRQLFSTMENIGQYKADVIAKEIKKIDDKVSIKVIKHRVQDVQELSGDYLIDCVDNIDTKIYLSQLSSKLDLPLLHGSCGGWYGQVGLMSPSCHLIEDLYSKEEAGVEKDMFNPPYIANMVASMMVSEFTKMIKKSPTMIIDEILFIDLFNHDFYKSGGEKSGQS